MTVAVLSIWAWFTHSRQAYADDVSATCRAEGVEVSWDSKDYFKMDWYTSCKAY